MTPRQTYWANLHEIARLTGTLNRRMTFKEAATWLADYNWYLNAGWPATEASQRSYDHYFVSRKGMLV